MSIILNENKWAKQMIEDRSLGSKPYETLVRVAKYFVSNGMGKKEVRRSLEEYLLQCDPSASITKWSNVLNNAVSAAIKYPAIDISHIDISDKEIKTISSLKGKQLQRLAFTLLCLAKYWDIISISKNHWVNSKDSDIMQMANINTSIKRQSYLYHTLNELGLIQFSRKVDNTNVRVCFIEDGETVLTVSDFRNVGYQYLKYLGEPYFNCINCGITTKFSAPVKGKKQKYCKRCAAEIAVKQNVNSAMRFRLNSST